MPISMPGALLTFLRISQILLLNLQHLRNEPLIRPASAQSAITKQKVSELGKGHAPTKGHNERT